MTATLKAAMTVSQKSLVISLLTITVGVGWLLTARGVAPQINWVWTLGMAVCGVLMFALMGFDKLSFVLGVFFLVCSLMSVLRQQGWLSVETEAPVLVITAGVLLLLARSKKVPIPNWFAPPSMPRPSGSGQRDDPQQL
jgi:uncharacterized membrane protein YdcZ (DUF606 family)